MIYDHLVKHNGVYYLAGEDVPIEGKTLKGAPEPIVEKVEKVETVENKSEEVEKAEEKKYTKTEINRMSTKDLRELANSLGIEDNGYVGSELKTILIEKLV